MRIPALKILLRVAFLFLPLSLANGQSPAPAAPREGIAVAIVYDTSGSMLEAVKDGEGKMTPKFQIASRSLASIIDRLETARAAAPPAAPLLIESGLVIFSRDTSKMAVSFGPFDPAPLKQWLKQFTRPQGATPLGAAVQTAGEAVLASPLSKKHVLILTDGMNTQGPNPAQVIPALFKKAQAQGAGVSLHFVAFDVDARVFEGVKKLGATVLGATDEIQLNTQLEFILEEKILLEAEEPAEKKPKKK